jgi:hypothetical protein
MKPLFSVISFFMLIVSYSRCIAQDKFYTKNGKIRFESRAPMEDIDAVNKSVTCVLDSKTGNIQFVAMIRGFEFKKALMQEHFNENYVESDKFPKGEFKGTVVNNSEINYAQDGTYPAKVKGQLTIHGQTTEVESDGTIQVVQGKLQTNGSFNINISDFNIKIPSIVSEKVSNTVKIIVDCTLDPLK